MNSLLSISSLISKDYKSGYSGNGLSFSFGPGSGQNLFTSNTQTVSGQGNTMLNGSYAFTYSSTQGYANLYNCFNSSSTTSTINFIFNGPFNTGNSGPQNYTGSASVGGRVGDWAKITLPNPQKWNSYVLGFTNQGSGWIDRYAYTFYLLGSNDNISWTQLDYYSQNSTTNPVASREIGSPDYYKYSAYVVTQIRPNTNGGGNCSSIAYFAVNGNT